MEQHQRIVTSNVVMSNIIAYHIRPANQWNAGQFLTDGQRINDTQGRCNAQGRAAHRTEQRSGQRSAQDKDKGVIRNLGPAL